jgi:D-arabinose 1-dehydrogenase-like Zn-dependent alcohol dehydrogenase
MSAQSTSTIPKKYRAAVVSSAKAAFELKELDIPELKSNQVLVKVEACGLCHSDAFVKEGGYPAVTYPRVPGHEVAGVVAAVGSSLTLFKPGNRVGRGWHGGHCFTCQSCRKGDFAMCVSHQVTGINQDGGYAEYMICSWESLAFLPDNLPFEEAGPLLCAGVTVFNSLRNCKVMQPAVVAVHGIGGLGHLAIQFAARFGYTVVAISTSADKAELAKQLGANIYIDTSKQNAVEELNKLGGAKVIMATVYDSKATAPLVNALATDGVLLTLGLDPTSPLPVYAGSLIGHRSAVKGWFSGMAMDGEECCKFAADHKVKCMVQTFPLDKVQEAYELMLTAKAKFRVVVIPGKK